jgi:predicted transcriptional regulator YheO
VDDAPNHRLFTAKTVAIATKVAVIFGVLCINAYLCTAKTVAIATKVAVEYI